jgi:hypothetical protein
LIEGRRGRGHFAADFFRFLVAEVAAQRFLQGLHAGVVILAFDRHELQAGIAVGLLAEEQ